MISNLLYIFSPLPLITVSNQLVTHLVVTMNQFKDIVDDYIDVLLRDAAIRVGLGFKRAKPVEWCKLLDANQPSYGDNVKRLAYVMCYLMNHKTLMISFAQFFQSATEIPFADDIIVEKKKGEDITVVDYFKYKIKRFRNNVFDLSRKRYYAILSKSDNKCGGKGKKLQGSRSHEETLARRRLKRQEKTFEQGKVFYLYKFKDITLDKSLTVR